MILLIDNYDSFTHNLAQLLNEDVLIMRNDDTGLVAAAQNAQAIIISPGPGTPEETGSVKEIIQRFYQKIPILGICLGHQAIGEVFWGQVRPAKNIRHGKPSPTRLYSQEGIFKGLAQTIHVMRYHSLVLEEASLPEEFYLLATAEDDQEVMAIKHRAFPLYGIQFHPESIGTPDGATIMNNFIALTKEGTV